MAALPTNVKNIFNYHNLFSSVWSGTFFFSMITETIKATLCTKFIVLLIKDTHIQSIVFNLVSFQSPDIRWVLAFNISPVIVSILSEFNDWRRWGSEIFLGPTSFRTHHTVSSRKCGCWKSTIKWAKHSNSWRSTLIYVLSTISKNLLLKEINMTMF